MKPFSVIVVIPYRTLVHYTKADPTKHCQLGVASGPALILDSSNKNFLTDVIRHADLGNEGMSHAEAICTMQELVPVSRMIASKLLTRHILCNLDNVGLLKSNLVVVQPTTTKGDSNYISTTMALAYHR